MPRLLILSQIQRLNFQNIRPIHHTIRDNFEYYLWMINPDLVILLKLIFEQAGFKVDGYTDPLIALSKFKTNTYDIAILDIKMLGLNGLELYERLIQIDSRVIVFFLTAYEIYKEALEQLLPNLSKYYFISKPIDLSDLVRRVRTEYESLR